MKALIDEGSCSWTLDPCGATFYFNMFSLSDDPYAPIYTASLTFDVNGFCFRDKYRLSNEQWCMEIEPRTPMRAFLGGSILNTIEVKGDVNKWLYLYANGTYQDLRDVRELTPGTEVANPTYGLRIPNIPYLLGNFGAELHRENLFGGEGQNTRLLLDGSYVHEYFYDFEVSKYQERKIPTSFTMDAALEHSFMDNRLTLTLRVKNLTDSHVVSEFNRPLPGRYIGFKIRYVFR